jgi:hypothetical protein
LTQDLMNYDFAESIFPANPFFQQINFFANPFFQQINFFSQLS